MKRLHDMFENMANVDFANKGIKDRNFVAKLKGYRDKVKDAQKNINSLSKKINMSNKKSVNRPLPKIQDPINPVKLLEGIKSDLGRYAVTAIPEQ